MLRGYKIRLYPTKEQEEKIWRQINGCRFIWNYMLRLQIDNYKAGNKQLQGYDMMKLLPSLKKQPEFEWLSQVSNGSLQSTCGLLAEAYSRFFNKVCGYPKFKSKKKAKTSYQVRSDCMYFKNDSVFIQKVGKVKYKTDYSFETGMNVKHYNVRLHFRNNKYILTFTMECENQAPTLTDKRMGIDLGVKELATVAFGDKKLVFHNINNSAKIKRLEERISKFQRSITRKYTAVYNKTGEYTKSNNIIKAEKKLAKMRNRRTNIKNNYIHQTTKALIKLLPYRITMESLNVEHMLKDKHLRKRIQEQCFHEFIRQIQYKCENNNIEFIQADRYYPSSKTCSCCGSIKKSLKLSDRVFLCDECGLEIDRDYNAAINLMKYEIH